MKQILLSSIVILCYAATAHAQIKKGSLWLGGYASYGMSKSDAPDTYWKSTNVSMSPAVGSVVKDNLVVGVEFTHFGYKRVSKNSDFELNTRQTGGGVFVRKYFPVLQRFYVFGQASLEALATKDDQVSPQDFKKGKGFSTSLIVHPGVAFALTKHFHLETGLGSLFSVGYNKMDYDLSGGGVEKQQNFSSGVSFEGMASVYLGIRFII